MLELAAYFALVQVWSAISAAAILGVVNFVIAAVLFVMAGGRRRGANSNSPTRFTARPSMRCKSRPGRCSRNSSAWSIIR